MTFRKKEFLRQNIEKKDSGQIVWVSGMGLLLVLGIFIHAQLQIMSWHATSLILEDALAASELASELIDVQEYGRTHKVRIADPQRAYDIYCDAVKENLNLDSQWLCANRDLIGGKVEIEDFIVYNVTKEDVTASRVDREGRVTESWSAKLGEEIAPNGIKVEHTGIYSEIAFPVQGLFGIIVQAHKGKLSDIVSTAEMTEEMPEEATKGVMKEGEENEIR